MGFQKAGRRQFLKGGVALAGLAVGGGPRLSAEQAVKPDIIRSTGLHPQGTLSPFEKSARTGTAYLGYTPLQDSQGIITPSALHYYMNHEEGVWMNIDPQQHRLTIHGLVERPVALTMSEIKRLPSVSRIYFLECNANSNPQDVEKAQNVQQTHGLTSCSEWTGVPLSLFLREAGVKPGATWLLAGSADPSKHASSIPLFKAMDDVLVAYGQNGESLRLEQGYPLRLIVPGWGGRVHVKWLNRIKVVDQPYMTIQDRTFDLRPSPAGEGAFLNAGEKAISLHNQMYAKSVITYPSPGHQLAGRGFYEISGLAWSGSGVIRRVEVSTDGGTSWKDAQLQEPSFPKAHTRFRFGWKWNGEESVLQSRATDEQGDRQPSVSEWNKFWGSDTSQACISVLGEACQRIPTRADRAYVQSWKIAGDGSVRNAFVAPDPSLLAGPGMRVRSFAHDADRQDAAH